MKPRLATACLAAALATGTAHAQMACDERDKVLEHLESKYGEKPVALGMATNGSLVEILEAKGGATWTIVITNPNGTTCLMAAGEHWEQLPEPEPGSGT